MDTHTVQRTVEKIYAACRMPLHEYISMMINKGRK